MAKPKPKPKPKPKTQDSATASAKITRYIDNLADWRGKTLATIRKAFKAADPNIVEEWKWMGSPVWSHGGIVAVANAHKDKVKVTFMYGASLADPDKIFNAGLDGNKWRAIDIHESDKLDVAGLKNLIRTAVSFNLARGK